MSENLFLLTGHKYPFDNYLMKKPRCLALIAHDNKKTVLLEWAESNRKKLQKYKLFATGTTGSLLEKKLNLKIKKFKSGPLGGDLQIGAAIAEGKIHQIVFFTDPMSPHPHDVDVKALLRVAVVYDVPIACNRASAQLMLR